MGATVGAGGGEGCVSGLGIVPSDIGAVAPGKEKATVILTVAGGGRKLQTSDYWIIPSSMGVRGPSTM